MGLRLGLWLTTPERTTTHLGCERYLGLKTPSHLRTLCALEMVKYIIEAHKELEDMMGCSNQDTSHNQVYLYELEDVVVSVRIKVRVRVSVRVGI